MMAGSYITGNVVSKPANSLLGRLILILVSLKQCFSTYDPESSLFHS